MRRMKTQTTVHLMWLLILVLQFAWLTKGMNHFIVPQNLTSETGKTVTFECGVIGLNGAKIRFYIMGPKVNDSVSCPGDKTKYLPAQSMKAYCNSKSTGEVAAWEVAGTSMDDNSTIFLCKVDTLDDKIGHLYVYENDSYYAKLIGMNHFIVPQNLTSETGKTVTFECGVIGLNGAKIRFYIMGPKVNDSVSCPGDKTKYLPAQSMKAYCNSKSTGEVAAWEVAGTSMDDNSTIFLCKVDTLDDKIGHLYVYENDSYYAKLIGMNHFIVPQNLTSETGKTVTFECGVIGLNGAKIRFYIMGPKVNDSVSCPGDKTKYLPAQSMKAYCKSKSTGEVAAWEVAGTSMDDNSTIFLCKVDTLDDKIGHLYVYENDSYYAKLIGYVIGGFLAALITIIVAYVLLKRSEKVQHCFRSVGGIQDDVQ
ncbi:uncharacterized protein LOC127974645 [Carassius gibelio]|uniref:uncharacterized protein LOC127974645 n=1 Tax=Carassius gibelio TaxID=101364 RepID=UPI0022775163|nr:uncharacterized protein LOC127974645 [Carassius gibelio]